jgi:hypothetical protein
MTLSDFVKKYNASELASITRNPQHFLEYIRFHNKFTLGNIDDVYEYITTVENRINQLEKKCI